MTMVKETVVAQLIAQAEAEVETAKRALASTREGATHEEAKPENDKDTRALEASYLAGGQAERVRELETIVTALKAIKAKVYGEGDPIGHGALITLESADETRIVCFMAPVGGGLRANCEGVDVQLVTPRSPLGQALVGNREGDDVEVQLQGKRREYSIVAVR
jgi:transcription elongation GreA/GreB family factor